MQSLGAGLGVALIVQSAVLLLLYLSVLFTETQDYSGFGCDSRLRNLAGGPRVPRVFKVPWSKDVIEPEEDKTNNTMLLLERAPASPLVLSRLGDGAIDEGVLAEGLQCRHRSALLPEPTILVPVAEGALHVGGVGGGKAGFSFKLAKTGLACQRRCSFTRPAMTAWGWMWNSRSLLRFACEGWPDTSKLPRVA